MQSLSIKQTAKKIAELKASGKKVALIDGCFDVLHTGHINLFRFAKKYADILVIGLYNDKIIRVNKGQNRPIHEINERAKFLSEIKSVDLVFEIEGVYLFKGQEIEDKFRKMLDTLKVNYIVTNQLGDRGWRKKQAIAEGLGIKLLLYKGPKTKSTTTIAQKIAQEN